jgi:hypothetical protein
MSCGACDCDDCQEDRQHDKAMNRSNDMDDEQVATSDDLDDGWATPIQRPTWQDAEPANEAQAKAWMGYINETFDTYKVKNIPSPALVSIVCQKIPGLRPENYYRMAAQVERFIRESPSFEIRRGKNGGVFRKDPAEVKAVQDYKDYWKNQPLNFPIASGTLPAPIHNVVSVTIADNYTCKGCGNSKLNSKEKSCWKCGRTVGT